jgi:hypothetical protein
MAIHMTGFFERYEEADADHYARTFPLDNDWSRHITIVEVTDAEYRDDLFNSRSPLNPEALMKLVAAVQSYRPRVIGLDVLTDWPSPFEGAVTELPAPLVWARDGSEDPDAPGSLIWNKVRGIASPPPELCFGVPVNQPDLDGTIRHYTDSVRARNDRSEASTLFPTMAHVLASNFEDRPLDCRTAPETPPKRINFTGKDHNIRALHAADVIRDSVEGRYFGKYLTDRIVIIGGTYAAARDRYPSAGGYLNGVEILAHSVESEISGPIKDLPLTVSAVVNLTLSVLIFLFLFRVRSPFDLLLSAIAVVAFTFISAWALYSFGFFSSVSSSLFGVPIGVIAEHFVECKILRHEKESAEIVESPAEP